MLKDGTLDRLPDIEHLKKADFCHSASLSHQQPLWLLLAVFGIVALFVDGAASPAQAQMTEMPPWADDDFDMTSYDLPVLIHVLGNDLGGNAPIDPTTVVIVTQPLDGVVVVDPATGDVIYAADPGFAGADTFEYTVADINGLVSNVAFVDVYAWNDPPEIIDFDAIPGPADGWFFEGTVLDENPAGLTITFGGILTGHSTTTKADGSFSYTLILDNGEAGLVTAQTTDDLGEESNEALSSVIQF